MHDSRNNSSYRRPSGNRHSSPPFQHSRNSRSHEKSSESRGAERMGPPSRVPLKKFRSTATKVGGGSVTGNYRSVREPVSTHSAVLRKAKIATSIRAAALRRKLLLRQRDSARRVKLARIRRYLVFKTSVTIECPT